MRSHLENTAITGVIPLIFFPPLIFTAHISGDSRRLICGSFTGRSATYPHSRVWLSKTSFLLETGVLLRISFFNQLGPDKASPGGENLWSVFRIYGFHLFYCSCITEPTWCFTLHKHLRLKKINKITSCISICGYKLHSRSTLWNTIGAELLCFQRALLLRSRGARVVLLLNTFQIGLNLQIWW